MTSPNIKIIEFYAQEKYELPKAGVSYKPQKFYVDVKLEGTVTIDDMADNIVQRLKTATKREGIITKRITCRIKFSFVDYIIEEEVGYSSSERDDNFLQPYKIQQITKRPLLYISGDIHPSNYYHIEGYPSYETVRILADILRKQGIKEAQEELKIKVPVKSDEEGEGKRERKDKSKDIKDIKKGKKKK